jgi:hypothetical protein
MHSQGRPPAAPNNTATPPGNAQTFPVHGG